jgi:hypothetical protein
VQRDGDDFSGEERTVHEGIGGGGRCDAFLFWGARVGDEAEDQEQTATLAWPVSLVENGSSAPKAVPWLA